MQTAGQVKGTVAALVGDPDLDWLTDSYFYPLLNQAYNTAINTLALSCSPYIEKVVTVTGVMLGSDESNLGPNAQVAGQMPLQYLKKPRLLQWKPTGTPPSRYRQVQEFSILPNSVLQVTPLTVDVQVRGDFMPPPLTKDSDIVQIHPNMGPALAFATAAIIGLERPNEGWAEGYGQQGLAGLSEIAAELTRQQQHVTMRLGSPNRGGRGGSNFQLGGNMGWEWRSFGLYVKLL